MKSMHDPPRSSPLVYNTYLDPSVVNMPLRRFLNHRKQNYLVFSTAPSPPTPHTPIISLFISLIDRPSIFPSPWHVCAMLCCTDFPTPQVLTPSTRPLPSPAWNHAEDILVVMWTPCVKSSKVKLVLMPLAIYQIFVLCYYV
jgi:hypothetical protein